MNRNEIQTIAELSEALEVRNNEYFRNVLETHDNHIAMNVLINVATSMLAKALIMSHPESREAMWNATLNIVDAKVAEGHAAVVSLMAIDKAMGSTCSPLPPKKH
jgi:ribonuclease BN (tRNA processing enzyme)